MRENNQTNNLPYSGFKKDASRAMASDVWEYLLLFRRPHTPSDVAGGVMRVTLDEAAYPLPRWQLDANRCVAHLALGFRRTRPHTPSFVPS